MAMWSNEFRKVKTSFPSEQNVVKIDFSAGNHCEKNFFENEACPNSQHLIQGYQLSHELAPLLNDTSPTVVVFLSDMSLRLSS
ncbi:hypothetical protein TNIN_389631 [Trichonephila inaurata madagascariensis]|uniref:Uncharacterized protein n=1 Tax=Trichonephila inaurata madagascariensis TaxID=2747483 RepID=A0A8X7BVP0_9ARAC|nr:hypothetical protein TNIN_389631 [Trichonephila inaurata madagascariensis]